jgi:spore coat protein U-like protein
MKFSSFKAVSKFAVVSALACASVTTQAGQTTGSLNVSANVQATCVIDSVDSMTFGNYTQGVGPVDASAAINLNCGLGVVYSVRLSGMTSQWLRVPMRCNISCTAMRRGV